MQEIPLVNITLLEVLEDSSPDGFKKNQGAKKTS